MLAAFTLFHVALSLVGIGAGFVFVRDLLASRSRKQWTDLFLWTTIATSVTGFLFPVYHLTPAHIVGVISLALLAAALYARSRAGLRRTWIVTTLCALYLNVFVLVAQLFLKVPPLHALAPTQTEPVFPLTQGLVLLLFCVIGFRALRVRPASVAAMA